MLIQFYKLFKLNLIILFFYSNFLFKLNKHSKFFFDQTKEKIKRKKKYFFSFYLFIMADVNYEVVSHTLLKRGLVIQNEIGRGAQGVCYVVFSKKYNTQFVCKCMRIKATVKNDEMSEFEREIYLLSHIIHQNIVKIYDHFTEADHLFMIIEYCEHGNLLSIIKEKYTLQKNSSQTNYDYIRRILKNVLSALSYCHNEIRISHHDIKPSNILIDSFGRAKLCDFGISYIMDCCHLSDANNTYIPDSKLLVCGSLLYMSPELIQYAVGDIPHYDMFAADIWAFGVTAYTLLCSHHPFKSGPARVMLESFKKQVNYDGKTPELSIFNNLPKDLPDDIRKVIEMSLVFDQKQRAKASELLYELENNSKEDNIILGKPAYSKVSESVTSPALLLIRPKPTIKVNSFTLSKLKSVTPNKVNFIRRPSLKSIKV